jgi:hypothetical protein
MVAPRGVRMAAHSTEAHWWRPTGRACWRGRLAGRAAGGTWLFATMGYLAILRCGVAIRAITSVRMFMTT